MVNIALLHTRDLRLPIFIQIEDLSCRFGGLRSKSKLLPRQMRARSA